MLKIYDNIKNIKNNNYNDMIINYFKMHDDVDLNDDYYQFIDCYDDIINYLINKYNNFHFIDDYDNIHVEIVIFNMNDYFNYNCKNECDFILFNVIYENKYIHKLQNNWELFQIDVDDMALHEIENDNIFTFFTINNYNKQHNLFKNYIG